MGLLFSCAGNHSFHAQKARNYAIHPGDVIHIHVLNYPQYNQKMLVDFSGVVSVADIGEVFVHDFTVGDVEVELTKRYAEFLVKPTVSAKIFSRKQHAVYMAGKIKEPGVVRYRNGLTVAQSIRLAGGIRNIADKHCAYVLRKKADGNWTKFKIQLEVEGGRSKKIDSAFKLAPYDIVYVTQSTEKDADDSIYGSGFGTEI